MTRKRKIHTPEQKMAILKEHLAGRVPVSELCSKYQISPSLFYRWQVELFDHGAECFDKSSRSKARLSGESKRVQDLENQLAKTREKLAQKHEVVSELMEAHIKLKKSLGEI